jgi:hypothetical protein
VRVDVDEWIILKWILKKWDGAMDWTELAQEESDGGRLCTLFVRTIVLSKVRGLH